MFSYPKKERCKSIIRFLLKLFRFNFYFRKLADVSRSTKGVVVLISDEATAVRILTDAKRLNMLDGHFVWIWIDTAETKSGRNNTEEAYQTKPEFETEFRRKRSYLSETRKRRSTKTDSGLSDMHINYLLKNDQFLLFHDKNNGVESSKFKTRNDILSANKFFNRGQYASGGKVPELPVGLLSLRPTPIRIDRHLVKGAVRLLVATFKSVITRYTVVLDRKLHSNGPPFSCWKTAGHAENHLALVFGR